MAEINPVKGQGGGVCIKGCGGGRLRFFRFLIQKFKETASVLLQPGWRCDMPLPVDGSVKRVG